MVEESLYIKNIGENEAEIFLYDFIGLGGIHAQDFVNELQMLDSMGLDVIKVRINSKGGDVIEGMGIFTAIQNAKTPVDTYVDGVAASMAAVIAMAGRKRFISDFGQIMLHNPRPQAGKALDAKTRNAIDALRDSLVTMLDNNASLTADQVAELMDVETWLNADEAKAKGLIDGIVVTERKHREELQGKDTEAIAAYTGGVILNELINEFDKPNNSDMLNIVNHLGLEKDAKEDAIIAKIKEVEGNLATATTEKEEAVTAKDEAVTAKDEALETVATLTTERAEMAVEAAIKDGKVDKKDRETLVATAKENYEAFKTVLNSVTVAPASIIAALNPGASAKVEGRENWTMRDWEKKDPKGLSKMQGEDPTGYQALYDETYKTD